MISLSSHGLGEEVALGGAPGFLRPARELLGGSAPVVGPAATDTSGRGSRRVVKFWSSSRDERWKAMSALGAEELRC